MEILGNIEWSRGDSFPMGIRVKDKFTGEYIDITGYTFLFTVNPNENPIDDNDQLFQVIGAVDPDQVNNRGWVYFTPEIADTAAADIKLYYYDIQMSYMVGRPRTVAKFEFDLVQDITKKD